MGKPLDGKLVPTTIPKNSQGDTKKEGLKGQKLGLGKFPELFRILPGLRANFGDIEGWQGFTFLLESGKKLLANGITQGGLIGERIGIPLNFPFYTRLRTSLKGVILTGELGLESPRKKLSPKLWIGSFGEGFEALVFEGLDTLWSSGGTAYPQGFFQGGP